MKKKYNKINPYLIAWNHFVKKMFFDFSTLNSGNSKRLKEYHNKFRGGKCVIICNGPSLRKVNFNELREKDIFTIGLNKVDLLKENFNFSPNLIACVNSLVVSHNPQFFSNPTSPLFIDFWAARHAKIVNNILKKNESVILYSSDTFGKFAEDISSSINQGCTVTFVALQIAFYLGFNNVALIGCDHSFATKGSPNLTITQRGDDESHFDPNYFGNGMKWQLPDLTGSEFHYELAREVYNGNSRNIFNCTEGGKLEVFKRLSLSEFYKLQ